MHLRVGIAEAKGELWSGRVYGSEEDGCPGGGGSALVGCGEGGFLEGCGGHFVGAVCVYGVSCGGGESVAELSGPAEGFMSGGWSVGALKRVSG